MSIASVSPVSAASTPSAGQSSSAATTPLGLSQSQFFQLLTAQLQNQDPLNPVSSTDFTTQLSQLSMVSGIQQLNTNFQQLIQLQQLSQGAALVGKTVNYSAGGDSASGVVQSVSLSNGNLQLQVNGQSITADKITAIVQGSKGS